jgi:hypothetical protein
MSNLYKSNLRNSEKKRNLMKRDKQEEKNTKIKIFRVMVDKAVTTSVTIPIVNMAQEKIQSIQADL